MITNDLISYIENEVKRGVSHEAINQALISAGWKALEVADALRIVSEREHNGQTGTHYTPSPTANIPQKETINQSAVNHTLGAVDKASHTELGILAQAQEHTPPIQPINPTSPVLPAGGFIPNSGAETAVAEVKIIEAPIHAPTAPGAELGIGGVVTAADGKKIEHHKLLPVLIVLGLVVFLGGGYFLLSPVINNPAKKIATIVTIAETAKSIQYSGEYEITAPAGLIIPDKVLISSFGGIAARQSPATMKGAFGGVDDWFDFRSKKNEVKLMTKIGLIGGGSPMEFSVTSRLISNALYSKVSESAIVFDGALSNQGANWIRFDEGIDIPAYAYGFFGGANLYSQGFARALAQYIASAEAGASAQQTTGETVIAVAYPDSIVTYFTSIFITGDKLGVTGNIGPKYPATSLTETPTGEITLAPDGTIAKAVISFAYKTKEYILPVKVKFTISYNKFDTPPAINIPSLVVPYGDLNKKEAIAGLPESLQGFFSDIRTIASVYKGINQNSYKGVCIKKGDETEDSTELTVPYVSSKVFASGYELPVCADTDTAWSYYTKDASGAFYCTDSRGFIGKASRQPLGDKCN